MITYRQFSRFVRWWRWEIRAALLVMAAVRMLGCPVPVLPLFACCGVLAAWVGRHIRGGGKTDDPWPLRVRDRADRHREFLKRQLDGQPLRGWTK